MEQRVKRLERTQKLLGAYAVVLTVVTVALVVLHVLGDEGGATVLRATGLVIEDEQGRERILIGAPVPHAANRVRTDTSRVRQIWARRFPDADQYMGFYENYRHAVNGIVFLDENGFDRMAIGDSVPDPNIGRRIGPQVGLVINDHEGFERSGFGLLKVDDLYRVVFGLDSDRGTEGLTLVLYDDGRVGINVRDGDRSLFLGSAPDGVNGVPGPFHGLLLKEGDEIRHSINVARDR